MTIRSKIALLICSLAFTLNDGKAFAQSLWKVEVPVYFETDRDVVREEFRFLLREKMLDIGSVNIRKVELIGHTDSDADENYNIHLSGRRARNTADFLISQGVKHDMLRLDSLGETVPISEVKGLNRRVNVVFWYERSISEQAMSKKRVVQGFVFDAVSKKRIQAEYIIEYEKSQKNLNTNPAGFFRLWLYGASDQNLTFIKSGYLNAHYQLKAEEIALSKLDTITIQIYLNPVEVVEKITLKNIYFYTDTDVLKPESYPDLEKLLKSLKDNPEMLIEIQGHMNFATNRVMNRSQQHYNLYLSHKRAKSIYEYLISNGIDRKRLSYKGMSNFKMIYPIPKNKEEEDMNKRVEIYSLKVVSS